MMSKRFDTRFFLARAPALQIAVQDNHETTEVLWTTPRQALVQYWAGEILLAPPQIMSLSHLSIFNSVDHALEDAALRTPPVIQPVQQRALPGPSRLHFRNKRFEPEGGLDALLHGKL
jgi:hypothetical protein